jgi:heptaprenyl diphosphate synthase
VISLSTDTIHINQLKKKVENKLNHQFLDQYIHRPEVDEEKLRVLATILCKNTELANEQKERFLIAAMLVQIALDTHEHVSIQHNPEVDSKEKILGDQLRVLAGDYYSGLYYYLLAEIQEFDFIHQLAAAIKEINENKMKLYYEEVHSFEEMVTIIQKIESLLFVSTAKASNRIELIPVIEHWLLLIRLLREKQKLNSKKKSFLDHRLSVHLNQNKQELESSFYSILQQTKMRLNEALTQLPAEYSDFKRHIYTMLGEQGYRHNQVAEEG